MTDINDDIDLNAPLNEQVENEQDSAPENDDAGVPDWAQAILAQNQRLAQEVEQLKGKPEDDDSWRYDNDKLYEKLREDLNLSQRQMAEEFIKKPQLINDAVRKFAGGNEKAEQVIREQLEGLSAQAVQVALTDKKTREALELMAEGAKARTSRPKVDAPRQEGIQNKGGGGLTADEEREVQKMHRGFASVFGDSYTLEHARAAFLNVKGKNGNS